jgi:hypothetical protein
MLDHFILLPPELVSVPAAIVADLGPLTFNVRASSRNSSLDNPDEVLLSPSFIREVCNRLA